jgi:hypothetical protein
MKGTAPLARLNLLVGLRSLTKRRIVQNGKIGAQGRIGLPDSIQNASRDLDRAEFAIA